MSKPSKAAYEISSLIKDAEEAFAKSGLPPAGLKETLDHVFTTQLEFEERSGIYFDAQNSSPGETAKKFTELHINAYRDQARPSLLGMAEHHANKLELDQDDPMRHAMIMMAVRAEMSIAADPDYHDKNHYLDVTAAAANWVYVNDKMADNGEGGAVKLSKDEQAMVILTAIGHDIDHKGVGNPKDDPIKNEVEAYDTFYPLLEAAGLSDLQMERIRIMMLTTSPNGPHMVLKNTMKQVRDNGHANWDGIENRDDFPDLEALAKDRNLLEMAAMLSDADLYPSFGAGLEANIRMSANLTNEVRKSGVDADFNTAKARKGAIDFVVGGEFVSAAGRKIAGPILNDMHHSTMYTLNKPKGYNA